MPSFVLLLLLRWLLFKKKKNKISFERAEENEKTNESHHHYSTSPSSSSSLWWWWWSSSLSSFIKINEISHGLSKQTAKALIAWYFWTKTKNKHRPGEPSGSVQLEPKKLHKTKNLKNSRNLVVVHWPKRLDHKKTGRTKTERKETRSKFYPLFLKVLTVFNEI